MVQSRHNGPGSTTMSAAWGRITAVTLFVVCVVTVAVGQARPRSFAEGERGAIAPKVMSRDLAALLQNARGSKQAQPVDVIVQFKHTPSLAVAQRISQLGISSRRQFGLLRGGVFRANLNMLQRFAADPEIAYISPDRKIKGAALTATTYDYTEATVGADVAQSLGWNGSGVTVAVIDSGISDHPDLNDPATGQSRVVYSESFVPNTDSLDHYGHGTHVAGIIAGNGSQSGGSTNPHQIYGVAPNVKLVNLKVLDSNGGGRDSYVIAALQRAIALKSTYNIRVVNVSLGRPVYESYVLDPLCQAVEAAWKAGLVVVVAAGNQGRDNSYGQMGYTMINAPGNDPYVITVGAMNSMGTPSKSDDVVATYSSKGPTAIDHIIKPDLMAPGNKIPSLLVTGSTLDIRFPGNEVSPTIYGASSYSQRRYFVLSGTSMAAPVVSGAAALMLQEDPGTSPDVIKARLMKTADKSSPQYSMLWVNGLLVQYEYDVFTIGAGYLNIPDALNNSDVIQGSALSPVAARQLSGAIVLAGKTGSVWNTSVIWGNSVVWGNALLSGTSVIWGNSVVWGNSLVSADSVIWGSSVVWGNSSETDDSNDAQSFDETGD
jgi:serine protease AprX